MVGGLVRIKLGQNERIEMTAENGLTSKAYALRIIPLATVNIFLTSTIERSLPLIGRDDSAISILIGASIVLAVCLYYAVRFTIARLNLFGMNPWMAILVFVPFVHVLFVLFLIFKKQP